MDITTITHKSGYNLCFLRHFMLPESSQSRVYMAQLNAGGKLGNLSFIQSPVFFSADLKCQRQFSVENRISQHPVVITHTHTYIYLHFRDCSFLL